MELYKYVNPDRIDIFRNETIRFTQVMELNDPFESEPFYKDYKPKNPFKLLSDISKIASHYKNTGEHLTGRIKEYEEERKRITKEDIYRYINNKVIGLSLTENKDNLLMWSLYANDHKGLMIEFDSNHPFFTNNDKILFQINYNQERLEVETTDFANSIMTLIANLEGEKKLSKNQLSEVPLLFSKSVDWIYENEWRLITLTQAAKDYDSIKSRQNVFSLTPESPVNSFYNNNYLALVNIPPTCIKSIYCGLRISKNLMRELYFMKNNHKKFSHINIYNTEMSDKYFRLNHREIEDYDVLTIAELEKNRKK